MSKITSRTREVIRFELMRNLKKLSFWAVTIALPLFFVLYIAIIGVSSQNLGESLAEGAQVNLDTAKIAFIDDANYVKVDEYQNSKGETKQLIHATTKDDAIAKIKSHDYDLFFYIPHDFKTGQAEQRKIEVYAKPQELKFFSNYSENVASLLSATALSNIDQTDLAVVSGQIAYEQVIYDQADNHVITDSEIISTVLPPSICFVLFLLLSTILGSRMMNSMVDEKENRINELLFTSLKPSELITGKIISLMILGIIQIFALLIPFFIILGIAAKTGFFDKAPALALNPGFVILNALTLIGAHFFFTAICVLVGVISPSAKDANNYGGIAVILFILPFIFMNIFMSATDNPAAHILTFFPATAPGALFFRSIFQNISLGEHLLALAVIFASGVFTLWLSSYIFRHNVLGFNFKTDFKEKFNAPRKTWKN